MTNDANSHVKIRFEVQDEDDPDEVEVETVWAKPVESGYEIDNIPFCAYGVALGDIVEATLREDGMLDFTRVAKPSGNSVIRAVIFDEKDVQRTRDELRTLGCASELMGNNLITVDIPAAIDYSKIQAWFERHETDGVLEYEEACLGYLPLEEYTKEAPDD